MTSLSPEFSRTLRTKTSMTNVNETSSAYQLKEVDQTSFKTPWKAHLNENIQSLPAAPMAETFTPETNVTVSVFPSYYHVAMVIKYVGGTIPLLQDSISFPRNFSILTIKDSKDDIKVTFSISELNNSSLLSLSFNRSLFPSEIFYIGISGTVPLQREVGPVRIPLWWEFQREIPFQYVKVRLFPDIIFFNASSNPDNLQVDSEGFLVLTWSFSLTVNFNTTLSVYNTKQAINELLILPRRINAILTDITQHITLTFTNVALNAVNIKLQLPQWLQASGRSFILKAHAKKTILLSLSKMEARLFSGVILVSTNRSTEMLSVNVTITGMMNDQNNFGNPHLTVIGLIATVFSLIGMIGVLIIRQLPDNHFIKKKAKHLLKKMRGGESRKIAEYPTIEWAMKDATMDSEFRELFHEIVKFIPKKEQDFLHHVLLNPGCTQQEVAMALNISKSTASRMAKRLQSKKYLIISKNGMSHSLHINKMAFLKVKQEKIDD